MSRTALLLACAFAAAVAAAAAASPSSPPRPPQLPRAAFAASVASPFSAGSSTAPPSSSSHSARASPSLDDDDGCDGGGGGASVLGGRLEGGGSVVVTRRAALLSSAAAAAASVGVSAASAPLPASAADASAAALAPEEAAAVELKPFVDPDGLFVLNVPKRFYALRRKAKGDLPDERTGKGRRGSSIFTAGDMAKAEVIAVERFPAAALLEEAGIAPVGDLSTFPSIGKPSAVAELINARRERERQAGGAGGGSGRTNLVLDSAETSPDGGTLTFRLRTRIDVQKPELLLEQTGVSELYRVTLAKATLTSGDGNVMAVFASALQADYDGPDGEALRRSVDSFRALDRSKGRGGAGSNGGGER